MDFFETFFFSHFRLFLLVEAGQNLLNRKSMSYTLEKMLMDREYCGATECLENFVNSGGHTVAVQDTRNQCESSHVCICCHRITKSIRLEWTTGGFLINPLLKDHL